MRHGWDVFLKIRNGIIERFIALQKPKKFQNFIHLKYVRFHSCQFYIPGIIANFFDFTQKDAPAPAADVIYFGQINDDFVLFDSDSDDSHPRESSKPPQKRQRRIVSNLAKQAPKLTKEELAERKRLAELKKIEEEYQWQKRCDRMMCDAGLIPLYEGYYDELASIPYSEW